MRIQASRCTSCHNVVIPPRGNCPYCGPSSTTEMIEINPNGIILTYTSLEMPPEGFEPPVLLAMVELDEGANVLCLGKKEMQAKTVIGARVQIDRDSEGRFIYTVKE